MAIHPVRPLGPVAPESALTTAVAQQRAVQAGVQALGGANNYAAQSAVQSRQDVEARKQRSQLIGRKISTATLAALAPTATAHDEDEADAERESDAFGGKGAHGGRVPPPLK